MHQWMRLNFMLLNICYNYFINICDIVIREVISRLRIMMIWNRGKTNDKIIKLLLKMHILEKTSWLIKCISLTSPSLPSPFFFFSEIQTSPLPFHRSKYTLHVYPLVFGSDLDNPYPTNIDTHHLQFLVLTYPTHFVFVFSYNLLVV